MRGIHDRCPETADQYGSPGDSSMANAEKHIGPKSVDLPDIVETLIASKGKQVDYGMTHAAIRPQRHLALPHQRPRPTASHPPPHRLRRPYRAPARLAPLVPPNRGNRDRRGLLRRGRHEPARPHVEGGHREALHQPTARRARLPGRHRPPCSRPRDERRVGSRALSIPRRSRRAFPGPWTLSELSRLRAVLRALRPSRQGE